MESLINLGAFSLASYTFNPKAQGPTVLALHGWLDNAATFTQLAEALPNYKIVALDFVGHGHSDHMPEGVPYHFIDSVTHVVKVIRQLAINPALIIGHSMGAVITSLLAAVEPKLVKAWVAIDCFGPIVNEVEHAPTALKNAISQGIAAEKKQSPLYESFEKALAVREQVMQDKPGILKDIVSRGLEAVDGGFRWRTDPRLRVASAIRFTEAHMEAFMSKIEAPCLFIEAEQGIPHAKTYYQLRSGYCADVSRVVIPGGHHVHIESASACASAIDKFFSALTKG